MLVARSNEAKALGIPMGAPFHQIKRLCGRNGVVVFSSNYELYGDMSRRVVSVLSRFAPEMEIYSIDESFLSLRGLLDPLGLSKRMRETVRKWTGIPISVGLGKTKTLAKLANRLAKKDKTGCLQIHETDRTLIGRVPIEDAWGRSSPQRPLARGSGWGMPGLSLGLPPPRFGQSEAVTLERTQRELSGIACLEMEEVPQPRKNTCCSRSFGKPLTEVEELGEAVANYAVRASRKVRSEGSLACGLQVFLTTNRFRKDQPQYSNSRTISLDEPTDDPIRIVKNAKALLGSIYRKGYAYKKAGVLLLDLIPGRTQTLLFEEHSDERRRGFVDAIEEVAARYGQSGAFLAAQGSVVPGL